MGCAAILRAEEQGDAPKTRQTHQTVNDAGEQGQLAAEEEGHGVEPEEADAAPVQRADDHQDQRKFVDDHKKPPFHKGSAIACPEKRKVCARFCE